MNVKQQTPRPPLLEACRTKKKTMKRTWKSIALAALMITSAVSMSTSCSVIDDDLDDCYIDLEAEYELRLVTNESFELARTLSDRPGIAEALRSHLSTVFTDEGRDLDLSFYLDGTRQHRQTEAMDNAPTKQVGMTLPPEDYQHLAVANVQGNGTVTLQNSDSYAQVQLSLNAQQEIASQQTGLFTGRRTFTGMTWGAYACHMPLYMANSAAAIVLDPRTATFTDVKIYTTGFATSFTVADSTYHYDSSPLVRAERVAMPDTTRWTAFCAVSYPSREPAALTRAVTHTDQPFDYNDYGEDVWQYDCYVTLADGKTTRTTVGIRHPLRAGQLKVIVAYIDDDGRIRLYDQEVGGSTDLKWEKGYEYPVEI